MSGYYVNPLRALCTSDQPAAQAATYTTYNKYKGRTSMSSAELEPTIPAIEWLHTCALVRTVTGLTFFYLLPTNVSSHCGPV